ncbi:MAG: tRNA pseudouridine(55) synthase TruB [Bacteroidota bacterium]
MDGILVVDKPSGRTSHDVVAMLRRLTGEKKAGHTGTLDPIATGVLVVCFGNATKALPYLPESSKTYRVEARLGRSTDTQDRTGRVIEEHPACDIPYADLQKALAGFLGATRQLPPMYSAVQVGGERLYRLARAGLEVEREARHIEISAIDLVWPSASASPRLRFDDRFVFTVTGSRGLYVRTLCHDLGQVLGCGAHLTELRRLASGPFKLTDAVTMDGLTREEVAAKIMPLGKALGHLPAVDLSRAEAARVAHGNAIGAGTDGGTALARAVDPSGRTIAILARQGTSWQPVRVFLTD